MKKVLLAILGILLATSASFAAVKSEILEETTLTISGGMAATSDTVYIGDNGKTAFFVKVDETEVGGGVSVAVTRSISYDGTNWLDGAFLDIAGGVTPQTSETISSDGWYYATEILEGLAPYTKLTITCTGCDTDDFANVTAYIVAQR